MNRRNFILGSTAIAVSSSVYAEVEKNNKSLILIWLGGGISNVEFANPLPTSADNYRSIVGAVNTNADYQLGGLCTKLATVGDKLTVCRGFRHKDNNHDSATHYVMTSMETRPSDRAESVWPSYGSLNSYIYGANQGNGMPTYVKLDDIRHDGAAWLGPSYNGYPAGSQGIKDLTLNVDPKVFNRRLDIVDFIEKNSGFEPQIAEPWSDLRQQAREVLYGDVAKSFNPDLEPDHMKSLYNISANDFGKRCLIARRLIENGAKTVTVSHNGWDMHEGIENGFKNRMPSLDEGLFALISDIYDRGLDKDCMIVVTSEFSRTPINPSAGRDHNAYSCALMFSGGEYNHGRVIGSTDETGINATDGLYWPKDLSATIIDHMKIDKSKIIIDTLNRPRHLVENDSKVIL